MDDLAELLDQAVADGKLVSDAAHNVRDWLGRQCLSLYHPQIRQLITDGDWTSLNATFWTVIPFGTGGRRGPMGRLGPATINDRTVAESAHGMAVYLKKSGRTSGGAAVVAYDTRNQSRHFAQLTATTLAAHELTVFLFDSHRSTPELSFAVRHLNCDIGVMISASHNPPADNGFKAYWNNGGQVIAPHDKGIITEVEAAEEVPQVDFDEAVAGGRIRIIGEAVDVAYVTAVAALSQSASRDISAVYTPLHGVGESSIWRIVRKLGFDIDIFEDHRATDGNFPNVPGHLPNPEQLEVFDPVIDWVIGSNHPADLILASDPDADRLGVVVRNPEGGFTPLSGNQTGALLTDYLLRKRIAAGHLSPDDYVVQTLVTTPLTRAIAEGYGAQAVCELLVGFKYIAETMEERGTEHFIIGTEESIGFLAGGYCRDKDGAIAAMFVLELAAELKGQGRTLLDQLDDLHRQHGYHCEGQRSIYCEGPTGKSKIDSLMTTLRKNPPAELGSVKLVEVADYDSGIRTEIPSGKLTDDIGHPRGDLLIYKSDPAASVRVQIAGRPSGTEPKIKFYFFCQSDLSGESDLERARLVGNAKLSEVQKALTSWAQTQLH
ncbi:MAG: phospho-sugar mutase [Fuerstiella sp.]|nr:phospho-sugar mutase [Fuerstiella sp.]